jgi:hypothetical protein
MYLIYGDRTIIGFVGFAASSVKVRPKKSYFSSACEYVKLPFSLDA